jgi:hypothetical protein
MSRLLWIAELTKRALGSEPPDTDIRTFSKPEISYEEFHEIKAFNDLQFVSCCDENYYCSLLST